MSSGLPSKSGAWELATDVVDGTVLSDPLDGAAAGSGFSDLLDGDVAGNVLNGPNVGAAATAAAGCAAALGPGEPG